MKNVEGIIAVSHNDVIGQGSKLPWHHPGDLKRFKHITMGHAVLMGFPTFKGMVENYARPGEEFLSGRMIYVVGREPFQGLLNLNIPFDNVELVITRGFKDDLETILKMMDQYHFRDLVAKGDDPKLFIAGGAKVYRDYLPFAERVYLTNIDTTCHVDEETVLIDKTTHDLLSGIPYWRTVSALGADVCQGIANGSRTELKASYFVLDGRI